MYKWDMNFKFRFAHYILATRVYQRQEQSCGKWIGTLSGIIVHLSYRSFYPERAVWRCLVMHLHLEHFLHIVYIACSVILTHCYFVVQAISGP